MTTTWDDITPDNADQIVIAALEAQSRGEPFDQEQVQMAATLMSVQVLVNAGADIERAIDMFDERPHEFEFDYDRATGKLNVQVRWLDDPDPEPLDVEQVE